jgi:hypothetical protein
MTQGRTVTEPVRREVLECMRELLTPIPDLTHRYSNQVILLALLTHAGAGLRELLASGQCSREDVERWCRQLHDLAFSKRGRLRKSRRILQ